MRALACTALVVAGCGGTSPATPDATPSADAAPTCACTWNAPVASPAITLAAADELSGLAVSRAHALVWAHDDGTANDLFAFGLDGTSRGALHLPGAGSVDWEDVAIAPCGAAWCLAIGDIGDNTLVRATIAVYEVVEPSTAILGTVDVDFQRFEVAYPDGAHDAEALFVDPRDRDIYIITKVTTGASSVYRLPRAASGIGTAELVGAFTPPSGDARVTAADLFVDDCGARLLIRTHDRLFELSAGADASVVTLLQTPTVRVPVADEAQGEAVGFAGDGRSYVTTGEGVSPVLSRVSCAP